MRIFLAVAEANALNGARAPAWAVAIGGFKNISPPLKNQLGTQLFYPHHPPYCAYRSWRILSGKIVGKFWLILTRPMPKHEVQAVPFRGICASKPHSVFAHRHVAPHLPAFLKQFPHLTIELKGNDIPNDMIGSGVDLSIRISPQSDHDHLIYTELAPNSRPSCCNPKNILPKKACRKAQMIWHGIN